MKTVCPKGRVGSNPTLSVDWSNVCFISGCWANVFFINDFEIVWPMEKYPSWLKGLPWKGSRSLIAARGFKSLLLRRQIDELSDRKNLDN